MKKELELGRRRRRRRRVRKGLAKERGRKGR
jgi:hypothetical protein